MDKPKCWVKYAIKKLQLKVKVTFSTQHLGFSPYLTQIWAETTQHFLKRITSPITESFLNFFLLEYLEEKIK